MNVEELREEIRKRISDDELKKLTYQVGVYAVRKVGRLTWRNGSLESLPKGNQPVDLAYDAFDKLWSGERQWNPENPEWGCDDLLIALERIVDSLVSHLVESYDNRFGERFSPEKLTNLPGDTEHNDHSATPEQQLIKVENVMRILEKATGDINVEQVLHIHIINGISRPRQIADKLGISIKDVNNIKKRIWRIIRRLKDEDHDGQKD